MEPIILTDQSVVPNDELVFSYIGEKRVLWQNISDYLKSNHKDILGEWRFYNDGKCWLYRGLKKGKAVFWVGVRQDTFSVTFYMGNKAEALIEESNISPTLKDEFADTKGQKFRPITLWMKNKEDVENVEKLIEIKLKVK